MKRASSSVADLSARGLLPRQQIERGDGAETFPAAIGALFDLDFALRQATRADQHLIGNPNQVGGGKFRAGALIKVMIKSLDRLCQ